MVGADAFIIQIKAHLLQKIKVTSTTQIVGRPKLRQSCKNLHTVRSSKQPDICHWMGWWLLLLLWPPTILKTRLVSQVLGVKVRTTRPSTQRGLLEGQKKSPSSLMIYVPWGIPRILERICALMLFVILRNWFNSHQEFTCKIKSRRSCFGSAVGRAPILKTSQ